jgi:hypothetical protein
MTTVDRRTSLELKTLFGLPAHPLLVHIPVVFLPLAAIGAVAIALKASWRRTYGWLVVALGAVALAGMQLAMGSGEGLEGHVERSPTLHHHTQLAEATRPLAAGLLLAVVAIVILDRRSRKAADSEGSPEAPKAVMAGLSFVTVALAVVSSVWIVKTGHEGARATWEDQNMSGPVVGGDGD